MCTVLFTDDHRYSDENQAFFLQSLGSPLFTALNTLGALGAVYFVGWVLNRFTLSAVDQPVSAICCGVWGVRAG